MKRLYLPNIKSADFEAFRQILNDGVGATFEEWQQRVCDRIDCYRGTHSIVETYVDPQGFKSFCDAKGKPYSGRLLLDYAEFIGSANS